MLLEVTAVDASLCAVRQVFNPSVDCSVVEMRLVAFESIVVN